MTTSIHPKTNPAFPLPPDAPFTAKTNAILLHMTKPPPPPPLHDPRFDPTWSIAFVYASFNLIPALIILFAARWLMRRWRRSRTKPHATA